MLLSTPPYLNRGLGFFCPVQNICLLQSQHLNYTELMGNLKVNFKCFYFCFSLKLPYNDISTCVCSLSSALCILSLLLRYTNMWLFQWQHLCGALFQCISSACTLRLCFFQCCQVISVHLFPSCWWLRTWGRGVSPIKNEHRWLPWLHCQSSSSAAKFHVHHLTLFFKGF